MYRTNFKFFTRYVPVVIVFLTSIPSLAVVHGDPELLKTVAVMHKANMESIRTWKGEVIEEKTSTQGNHLNYHHRSACTFAYDQVKQAVRWNKKPIQAPLLVVDGKKIDDLEEAVPNAAMLKDGNFYQYRRSGKERHSMSISSIHNAKGVGQLGLDPRYYFSDPQGEEPFYNKLISIYKNAKNPELHEWYIQREGDIVTLEVQFEKEGINKCRYVFDLSRGGNLIRYSNTNPTVTNLYEYEYEPHEGVWVLRSYKWTNDDSNRNPKMNTVMSLIWKNSVVNAPLPEDEFTIEKLGIKPGEDIHDMNVGMIHKYGDIGRENGELPEKLEQGISNTSPVQTTPRNKVPLKVVNQPEAPTPQAEKSPSPSLDKNRISAYTYFGIILMVAVILAGITYKYIRRSRRE